MQTLTDQIKERWPGVTVYGVGDAAHRKSRSGHNEDDTPGSLPDQEDADTVPEHRAIDVMLGPAFTHADADTLVADLASHPENRARLTYEIWNGHIWSAKTGFERRVFDGDPHDDHVHVNGLAADDANTDPWILGRPPSEGDDEDMNKPILANLAGRSSFVVKEDGRGMRWVSSPWQLEAYRAMGAITLPPAPSPGDIVAVLGPFEGGTAESTIAALRQAG
jgi:hypothetical protein